LKKEGNNRLLRFFCAGLFLIYLAFLLYFALASEDFGRVDHTADYRYNLQLFQEIYRFWHYRQTVGLSWATINLLGNVVCFVPYGFFVPILRKKKTNFLMTGIYSFVASLAVEVVQLILKIGVFDVDDLFLNTIGGLIGYLFYCLMRGLYRKYLQRKCK